MTISDMAVNDNVWPRERRNHTIAQSRKDDAAFPFPKSLISTTLPYDHLINLDPPPTVLIKFFFPHDPSSYPPFFEHVRFLTEADVRGGKRPCQFRQAEQWKAVSKNDQNLISGFTAIVPRGCWFDEIGPGRRIDPREFNQPPIFELPYEDL